MRLRAAVRFLSRGGVSRRPFTIRDEGGSSGVGMRSRRKRKRRIGNETCSPVIRWVANRGFDYGLWVENSGFLMNHP